MSTTVVFMPNAPMDQMLDADVLQVDALQLVKHPFKPNRWNILGLGFVGGMIEPLTEAEVISRINDAQMVSWIPDMEGSTIVRGKGNTPNG